MKYILSLILNPKDWGYTFSIVQHSNNEKITVFPRNADGIFHLAKATGQWKKTLFPPNKSLNAIYSKVSEFVLDPSGNITMLSSYGLFTYDVRKDLIMPFPYKPRLKFNHLRCTLWDSQGCLWISAGADGLICWNPKTNTTRQFSKELEGQDPFVSPLVGDAIFEDSRSNIWIRRNMGSSVYVRQKDTIINLLHTINPENTFKVTYNFAEDLNGRVWVTSEENWIGYAHVHSPEKGYIKKINLEKYGVGGWSHLIRRDLNGHLWISNSEHLLEIDPQDLSKITKHSHQYGLESTEHFCFTILPTGELAFGGRNHIALAKPENLGLNEALPRPYITEIQVLNQPLKQDTAAFYRKHLSLGHNENFFSIGFSAQAVRLGEQTTFRYRLKDFENWVEAEDRQFANYTNVPSGHYTFQLQAANNEGFWNNDIYELGIDIATAWWDTWYFRTIVFLGLVGLIYGFYRYQLFQVKQRERLKTAFNKKLANVELTALLAQMNPHFLFNCLNSIDSYILKNKSREASEYLNNFARLMRLILQNSRSNYISLTDELEALELYIQMESLRFKDKFNYQINVDENIDVSSIDIPPMLIQPYVENAIWHGLMNKLDRTKGLLSVHLSQHNGTLQCVIEDNGVGRAKAQEINNNKTSTKRRSMGMAITRDRLELINQLYNLDAKVGIVDLVDDEQIASGTKVILEIPI